MLHRLILKIAKFQLPSSEHLSTVVKNISGKVKSDKAHSYTHKGILSRIVSKHFTSVAYYEGRGGGGKGGRLAWTAENGVRIIWLIWMFAQRIISITLLRR